MSDRNIRIIDADSSFGGAAGGAGLRVTGALAHPGPPLESPLLVTDSNFNRFPSFKQLN